MVRKVALVLMAFSFIFAGSAMTAAADIPDILHKTESGAGSRAEKDWIGASYGSGGWLFGVFAPNLKHLNDKLTEHGFGTFDGPMLIFGGGGSATTDTWRIGGFGGAGRMSAHTDAGHHAALSMGFGVSEFSRVWWSTAETRLLAGIMVGGGGASLQLSDDGPDSADDAFKDRYDTLIERGFALVGPSVGVEWDISRHIDFQLKAAYLFSFAGPWKHSATGKALSDLSGFTGPFLSIGLSFGGGRP